MDQEKPKKVYLLMVDEVGMALLTGMTKCLNFVEVQGYKLDNNPAYQLLANPIEVKDEQAKPTDGSEQTPES